MPFLFSACSGGNASVCCDYGYYDIIMGIDSEIKIPIMLKDKKQVVRKLGFDVTVEGYENNLELREIEIGAFIRDWDRTLINQDTQLIHIEAEDSHAHMPSESDTIAILVFDVINNDAFGSFDIDVNNFTGHLDFVDPCTTKLTFVKLWTEDNLIYYKGVK
jgi:hypothetical protein